MMTVPDFRAAIASSPCVFTIGVAGDSGSGKTTFTSAIRQILGDDLVSTLTLDDYHLLDRAGRRQQGITPLDPRANRISDLERDLADLKRGRTITKMVYNHTTGMIEGPVTFSPRPVLILEGLHPLYTQELQRLIDFSIFVDPDPEVKLSWKMARDTAARGYSRAEVEEERAMREEDYKRYIAPQREVAECVIRIRYSRYGRGLGEREGIYAVSMLQRRPDRQVKEAGIAIDLASIMTLSEREFLLEFSLGDDGRKGAVLTIDGTLPHTTVHLLEQCIEEQTGVRPISLFTGREVVHATDIVRLLLAWRIINRRIFIGLEEGKPFCR